MCGQSAPQAGGVNQQQGVAPSVVGDAYSIQRSAQNASLTNSKQQMSNPGFTPFAYGQTLGTNSAGANQGFATNQPFGQNQGSMPNQGFGQNQAFGSPQGLGQNQGFMPKQDFGQNQMFGQQPPQGLGQSPFGFGGPIVSVSQGQLRGRSILLTNGMSIATFQG
jgi:hypothetical protein